MQITEKLGLNLISQDDSISAQPFNDNAQKIETIISEIDDSTLKVKNGIITDSGQNSVDGITTIEIDMSQYKEIFAYKFAITFDYNWSHPSYRIKEDGQWVYYDAESSNRSTSNLVRNNFQNIINDATIFSSQLLQIKIESKKFIITISDSVSYGTTPTITETYQNAKIEYWIIAIK